MARFDWENAPEIKLLRTHSTKDFDLGNGQFKKIQSSALLHAYTDKGFEDIKTELHDYKFPEGKLLTEEKELHYIMDLPSWGTAQVEENGKIVRVYDKKGTSIFKYRNPIVVNAKDQPFKVISGENIVIETDKFKEYLDPLDPNRKVENSKKAEEATFEVIDNKLHFRLPKTLKAAYPLKAFDETDTGSTNNRDNPIVGGGSANNNYGTATGMNVAWQQNITTPYRGLVDWTLSSGSGIISKVTAYMYLNTVYVGSDDIEVYKMTRSWVESEATWNIYSTGNSWTTAGGDYTNTIIDSKVRASQAGWMSWDLMGGSSINPLTLAWGNNVPLLFRMETESGGGDVTHGGWFQTKEYGSEEPYLEITYTPFSPLPRFYRS